ncbi:vomeronasal type-1 receptor 4-like [Erethizon dorsatum]
MSIATVFLLSVPSRLNKPQELLTALELLDSSYPLTSDSQKPGGLLVHTTAHGHKNLQRVILQRGGSYSLKEKMIDDIMSFRDLAIAIMSFSQTIVGILGNFSLLYYYLGFGHNKSILRSIDLILRHLLIANSMIILSKSLPQTMAAFGLKHFLNDFGCKILLYIQRVGRGVSLGTICLLSVFQTIMISPMNSRWMDLKVKAPRYIGFSVAFCWILYLVVNFIFPMYVFGKQNSQNVTKKRDLGYCSTSGSDKISDSLYTVLFIFPEVLFSVLIIWGSSSMIFILCRHKQQAQHIRSSSASLKSSPESRATQSILVLVCTFVMFFVLSSILNVCVALFYNSSWWLVNISALLSVSFPTVSPFVLMSRASTVPRFCFVWLRNTKIS